MQSSACITASLGVSLLRNTFLGRFDCPSSPTLGERLVEEYSAETHSGDERGCL